VKVTLGLPVYDTYKAETVASILMGLREFPHDIAFAMFKGGYIDSSRETAMRYAIENGSDKLLFIDSDMIFPPDAMVKLVAHSKTIIGAAYNEKKLGPDGKRLSTVKLDDGKGGYFTGNANMPDAPFMCAAVATGFLALYVPVIRERMQPPYFEYDRQEKGRAGEDTFFCQKARSVGLEVWCDPTLGVRHMGDFAY